MDRRTGMVALQRAPIAEAEADDFSAGEVLADGVRLWLTHLPAYAGAALLLHAPLLLLLLLPQLPGWLLIPVFFAVELFVGLLVKAALIKAVLDAQRGLSSELRELFEALIEKAPAVLVVGVRILARAAGKLLLFVVPGLLYLSEASAAVPEIVAEGGSSSAALRRSAQLTEGVRFPVLAICAVGWTLAAAFTFASGLHEGGSLTGLSWMILYLCTRALDTSLAAVLSAIAYRHLCRRPGA